MPHLASQVPCDCKAMAVFRFRHQGHHFLKPGDFVNISISKVDCVWNVMAHAQKPDFVFRLNGRVHLNQWGNQFSRLLAAEVCASALVMLDTPCSEVVWRVLATHSIHQFPLHFPSCASPCAITFQLDSATICSKCRAAECLNVGLHRRLEKVRAQE